MSISSAVKANFDTMCRAIRNNDAALVEVYRIDNGEPVVVVCAVERDADGVIFTPFAYVPHDHLIHEVTTMDPPEEHDVSIQ